MKTLKTKEMIKREKTTGSKFIIDSDGYGILKGYIFFLKVIYISLPKGHQDINKHYDGLNPNVNEGLTFFEGNIFGWDYGHSKTTNDYKGDIKRALEFFKARGKKI
ncbi:MAG TPA: hypothetical protein ENI61_04065 [Ignavibacteria bacterium]|nr:hypothetical protein [Ignavibacteria bacterium]